MTPYFHSNRQLLRGGALVKPGNFGRLVHQAGESGSHWFRETVLEEVRRQQYSDKPSRLSSCFATDNIETAVFYHGHYCAEGYLYAVAIEDPSLPVHVGDFTCVQPMPRREETMEQIAERYWRHNLLTNVAGQSRPQM